MRAIFQERVKKGKRMLKKGKIFENLAKMYKIGKRFEKGQVILLENNLENMQQIYLVPKLLY